MTEKIEETKAQDLASPDVSGIEAGTLSLRNEADALDIGSPEQYEAARPLAIKVKNLVREIEGCFDPLKSAAHKTWKAIGETEERYLKPVKAIEFAIKAKMTAWAVKEKAEREEAQRLADLEARRVEEERRAEAARAAAAVREAAEKARQEYDKLAADALEAQAKKIEEAPPPPAPVRRVESRRPVLDGVAMRQQKVGEVVDAPALLRHLADHPELIPEAIEFRKAWIAEAARKGEPVPGIAFSVKTIAALGCVQRESDTQRGGHLPDMG